MMVVMKIRIQAPSVDPTCPTKKVAWVQVRREYVFHNHFLNDIPTNTNRPRTDYECTHMST